MGVSVTNMNSLCFSCHYGNRIISGKGSSFIRCKKHFEDAGILNILSFQFLSVLDLKSPNNTIAHGNSSHMVHLSGY